MFLQPYLWRPCASENTSIPPLNPHPARLTLSTLPRTAQPSQGGTTLTFDDGVAVNVIEYTCAPGDTNGNGLVELDDIAEFQRCFGQSPPTGACLAVDLTRDGSIDLEDHAELTALLTGP